MALGLSACNFAPELVAGSQATDSGVTGPHDAAPAVFDASADASLDCGNGNLEQPEQCDDGDMDDGDGCSGSCTIEPGFECSPDCQAVTGAGWDGDDAQSFGPVGDSNGGSPFLLECEDDEVLVGVEAGSNTSSDNCLGAQGIVQLRARCAPLSFASGVLQLGQARLEGDPQGVCNYGGLAISTLQCPSNSVVTTIRGNANGYLTQLQLACSTLAHTGGTFTLGAPTNIGGIGGGSGSATFACESGSVGIGIRGRDGQVVDRAALMCAPLSAEFDD